MKVEQKNRAKGCCKDNLSQILEKITLIITFASLSLNQTFLTLNLIAQNFKKDPEFQIAGEVDKVDGHDEELHYNVFKYERTFGLFEIMYLTATPYLFAWISSFMINKIITMFTIHGSSDDIAKTTSSSRMSRTLVILGLIILCWSFIF